MGEAGRYSGIKAVLFDKDGTLLDFQATWGKWSVRVIQELAGHDPALVLKLAQKLGVDLDKGEIRASSVVVAGSPDEIAEAALSLLPMYSEKTISDTFLEMSESVEPVLLGNVAGLFTKLRSMGLQLGVATNDGEAVARKQMQEMGLDGHLDFVVGFDSGHGGKPGPGMCLAFCAAMGIAPEQVAMVGDSLHDLHAGRAAGMLCVAVTSGLATADDLRSDADIVLDDIHALPAILR